MIVWLGLRGRPNLRTMKPSHCESRGQTLVLFTLTMFLMAVMVIFTLSIGQRVNDRMELQSSADATAYSEAVATARTMNSMAVYNRVEIAHTVSVMGAMSIISWVTEFAENVKNVAKIFGIEAGIYAIGVAVCCWPFSFCLSTCPGCAHGLGWSIGGGAAALIHWLLVSNNIRSDISVWNNETNPRWIAANAVGAGLGGTGGKQWAFATQLTGELSAQGLGNTINVNSQVASSPYYLSVAPRGPLTAPLNAKKLDGVAYPATGAVFKPNINFPDPYHAAVIADGSRGHKFTADRNPDFWGLPLTLPWTLNWGVAWNYTTGHGSAYIDTNYHGPGGSGPPNGQPLKYVAGDQTDHTALMNLNVFFGGNNDGMCLFGLGWFAWGLGMVPGLWSAACNDVEDQPSNHCGYDSNPHGFRPTPFPPFYDYNPSKLTDASGIYGQPTQYSLMSRKYDPGHPYPWEMNLTGGQFFSNPDKLQTLAPANITGNFAIPQEQIALGKGVVYYNRIEHSSEPPNLFAPYWRAGLTRLGVELSPTAVDSVNKLGPGGDVDGMLNSVDPEYKAAYDGLVAAGYKGFQ
jgi:hypothetical protein